MSNTVTAILCRALRMIRSSELEAYAAIRDRLKGMTIRFDFDDTLYLSVSGDEIVQSSGSQPSDVFVRGSSRIVRDIVHGKITLTQAVCTGKLDIAGAIGPLTCALSAMDYFVASLLRIKEARELLRALEAAE